MIADQFRAQLDHSVTLRAQARRLLEEAVRLDALRQRGEANFHLPIAELGQLIDGELCEDAAFIAQLNAFGHVCDRCGSGSPLRAVVRFQAMSVVLGICGECLQELNQLSLGQVVA